MALLIEGHDMQEKRISFVKDCQFREDDWNIVYVDESYTLSSHVKNKSWSDDSSEGFFAPFYRGQSLIIIHEGGENSFLLNALIIWKSTQAMGDCNHMIKKKYEKWTQEK
jgi:hypothetical protein